MTPLQEPRCVGPIQPGRSNANNCVSLRPGASNLFTNRPATSVMRTVGCMCSNYSFVRRTASMVTDSNDTDIYTDSPKLIVNYPMLHNNSLSAVEDRLFPVPNSRKKILSQGMCLYGTSVYRVLLRLFLQGFNYLLLGRCHF